MLSRAAAGFVETSMARRGAPHGQRLRALLLAVLTLTRAQLDDAPPATVRVTLSLQWQRDDAARVLVTMSRAALGFEARTLQLTHANVSRIASVQPYLSWEVDILFTGYDVSMQVGAGGRSSMLCRSSSHPCHSSHHLGPAVGARECKRASPQGAQERKRTAEGRAAGV